MYLFGGLQWICPLSVYFFMVKREKNAVPKFFKMFSIVQIMFIKDVILIQWDFSMISAPVRVLNDVIDSLNLFVKNKYNRWQPPSVLLNYIS